MSRDDDTGFKSNLPTRNHSNIGKGLENRLLDRLGANTIRKDFLTGGDGRVTMLATRAGFPEFSSQDVSAAAVFNRTFVFNLLGSTKGVVANKGVGVYDLKALGGITVGTCGYAIVSSAAHHAKHWFDVARMDGVKTTYNAAPTATLTGALSNRVRPPLIFAIKKTTYAVANTYGGKWLVEAFDRRGIPINSLSSGVGDYYNADHAAGASVSPDGIFNFYWLAAPKASTYQWWHRGVGLLPTGVVAETGSTGVVDVKVSPQVVGVTASESYTYRYDRPLYQYNRVAGSVDIVANGGYVYQRPVIEVYTEGSTPLYSTHIVSSETKHVGFTRTSQLYTNTPAELILSVDLSGDEHSTNTYNVGSAQSSAIKVQRDVNWRNTHARSTLSSSFGGVLFDYEFTNTLVTDKPDPPHPNKFFKSTSVGNFVYPYDHYDIGHGEWCYTMAPGSDVAACLARIAEQNAYRTEQLNLRIETWNALNVNAAVEGPFIEGYKENEGAHYYDTTTVTMSSRDYVYADIDEGVFIYLETSVERVVYIEDLKQTLSLLAGGYGAADSDVTRFSTRFIFSFRGVDYPFGGVGPVDTHPPPIYPMQGGTEFVFSQIPRPPVPVPIFCPPYTQQGNCPYIAYTTLAEEAAGAVPEVYVDFSILPVAQTLLDSGGVVQFPAYQANLVYGVVAQSPSTWTDILFPKPTRIQFCNGAVGPWQTHLGEGFQEAGVKVEISRI